MVGALSAGMGGTGRAAVQSNESLYLNPASIALMSQFYAGAAYQSGFVQKNTTRSTYSVNLTDGMPGTLFPASLGYRRHRISAPHESWDENEIKLAFGYRITDRLSFGGGWTHLRAEDEFSRRVKQNNGDLGFLYGLQPNWGLSINVENFVDNKDPQRPQSLQRLSQWAVGTQYIFEHFLTARYEGLVPLYQDNQKIGHRMGLGVALKSYFHMSFGYSVEDSIAQNWTSGGLAWMGPRLKIAYSYQTESRSGLGDRHLVDLWFDL